MKKILSILLVIFVIVSFTGCDGDPMTALTDFMGKMQNNVLGMNTEGAAKLDEAITNIPSQKVDLTKDDVKVSVGGLTVEKNQLEEAQKKLGGEDLVILAPMEETAKNDLIASIGKATSNPEAKKELEKKMEKKATPEQQKAVKGTAAVVSVAVDETVKKVGDDLAAKQPKVKAAVDALQKSIDDMTKVNSEEVTQADVAIMSLVQSFVTTTMDATTTKDESGNVTGVADEMAPEKQAALVDEATELYSAINALSPAAKAIDTNSIIQNVTDMLGGSAPAPASNRAIARAAATYAEEDLMSLGLEIPNGAIEYVSMAFDIISPVFEKSEPAKAFFDLSMSKIAYETVYQHNDIESIRKDETFNDLNYCVHYILSSALVEANSFFSTWRTIPEVRTTLDKMHVDNEALDKLDTWTLLDTLYQASKASLDKAKDKGKDAMIYIPTSLIKADEIQKLIDAKVEEGATAEAAKKAVLEEIAKVAKDELLPGLADQSKNTSLIQTIEVVERALFLVQFPEGISLPDGTKLDNLDQVRDALKIQKEAK